MKRREFFRYLALAALIASPLGRISGAKNKQLLLPGKKYANDIVTLGKTGIQVSRLAMGTGTMGFGRRSNQTEKLGITGLSDLLVKAYDKGINFWDSADQYGTHPHLKEALKNIPREKIVILTKTNASTAEEMKEDLDRFRQEIGTDYIDIILLHLMTDKDWPDEKSGAMDVLAKAREDEIIRAHGVSCHTLDALQTAANTNWVQVDLARINPEGTAMDADLGTVENILKQMHADGKGIIGMKIFGGGRLTGQVDKCLKYILHADFVDCFTIGQESQDQLNDLIDRIPQMSV